MAIAVEDERRIAQYAMSDRAILSLLNRADQVKRQVDSAISTEFDGIIPEPSLLLPLRHQKLWDTVGDDRLLQVVVASTTLIVPSDIHHELAVAEQFTLGMEEKRYGLLQERRALLLRDHHDVPLRVTIYSDCYHLPDDSLPYPEWEMAWEAVNTGMVVSSHKKLFRFLGEHVHREIKVIGCL